MKAVSRFVLAMVAAGLGLAPPAALAQTAPATTNTPASDAIGPRELQNFSLNGTVTKPAETPAPTTRTQPRPTVERPATDRAAAAAQRETSPPPRATTSARTSAATSPSPGQPRLDFPSSATATPASVAHPGFTPEPVSEPAPAPATLAPEEKLLLWPWLLLASILGVAGALFLWRRRSRTALAGGYEIDAYVAPEPEPAAPPRPAPPPPAPEAAPPKPVGIVSSRLRPWIDVAFAPSACLVEDDKVTIEFEVHLTNSGGAPARELLVEASMFNAGATQEQDIGAFFARPQGQGEHIEAIAPLQNVTIRTSLVAPRQNIQLFELAGHQVFVPLIAFNVIYRTSSGSGQTSVAYMLGRDTRSEKLGPFRADLGPKAFTSLGTLPLPVGVRT
jgi:hypothetical protein